MNGMINIPFRNTADIGYDFEGIWLRNFECIDDILDVFYKREVVIVKGGFIH
jgi:hypothetical protein